MARRLSQLDYFTAALDLLARDGLGGVTLATLCSALDVTRGSFYYHFTSIDDFMTKLLEYWLDQTESISVDWSGLSAAEIIVRVRDRATADLNHEAEREIRAYGRTRPETNVIIRQVDDRRRANVVAAFVRAGASNELAEALGRIGAGLLIAEQQRVPVDRKALKLVYDEWAAWATARILGDKPE